MYSAIDVPTLLETGFPIQKFPDQSLFSSSPRLIAASHVFHRLLTPRHPPFALNSLATNLYDTNRLNAFLKLHLILRTIFNCQRANI